MKIVTRVQRMPLIISFTIFFGFLTIGYVLVNLVIFQGRILLDQRVLWVVFLVNVALSAWLGWRFYQNRWHATLRYDGESFDLQVGSRQFSGAWRDYQRVSLLHLGYGNFAVRLYKDDEDFVEVPATDLHLDPSAFRFEAMRLIGVGAPSRMERT